MQLNEVIERLTLVAVQVKLTVAKSANTKMIIILDNMLVEAMLILTYKQIGQCTCMNFSCISFFTHMKIKMVFSDNKIANQAYYLNTPLLLLYS